MSHGTLSLPLLACLWGLAGGFSHCIGMCGIFVLTYSTATRGRSERPSSVRHVLFHAGRLLSLTALGAIAGGAGSIDHSWARSQASVSIVAGVILCGLALGFAGIVPWFKIPEPDVFGAGSGVLRRAFARVMRSENRLRPLMIGAFVGLLPCGLIYQCLIPAALAGSVRAGAFTMFVFGLGGIPGLLSLACLGNTVLGRVLTNPVFRGRMTYVSAAVIAVMGCGFVLRGLQNL